MTQTAKQQASNQRRSLRALRKRVTELSRAWSDVDGIFEHRLEALSVEIERIETEFTEFIEEEEGFGYVD